MMEMISMCVYLASGARMCSMVAEVADLPLHHRSQGPAPGMRIWAVTNQLEGSSGQTDLHTHAACCSDKTPIQHHSGAWMAIHTLKYQYYQDDTRGHKVSRMDAKATRKAGQHIAQKAATELPLLARLMVNMPGDAYRLPTKAAAACAVSLSIFGAHIAEAIDEWLKKLNPVRLFKCGFLETRGRCKSRTERSFLGKQVKPNAPLNEQHCDGSLTSRIQHVPSLV